MYITTFRAIYLVARLRTTVFLQPPLCKYTTSAVKSCYKTKSRFRVLGGLFRCLVALVLCPCAGGVHTLWRNSCPFAMRDNSFCRAKRMRLAGKTNVVARQNDSFGRHSDCTSRCFSHTTFWYTAVYKCTPNTLKIRKKYLPIDFSRVLERFLCKYRHVCRKAGAALASKDDAGTIGSSVIT